MDPTRGDWENTVAALAREPAGSGIAGPGARVLVWSLDGERLLWHSGAAGDLARRWAEDQGGNRPDKARLSALGQGLAPRRGFRLERWRVAPAHLGPPVTVACRIVTAAGEDALLTAYLDETPSRAELAPASRAESPGRDNAEHSSGLAGALPESSTSHRGRGRRFVWHMDSEGRFLDMSGDVDDSIGPGGGRIEGRRWQALVGRLVLDPGGDVARSLAARQSWTRHPVIWRDAERDRAVPVELSGTPVLAEGGRFAGHRGFGIAFPDEATPIAAGLFSDASKELDDEPAAVALVPGDPPAGQLAGLDHAISAAAALTGSAGETVFGVLRALFGPAGGAVASDPAATGHGRDARPPPTPTLFEAARMGGTAGALSPSENGALHEIARALSSVGEAEPQPAEPRTSAEIVTLPTPRARPFEAARILDRLPIPVLILRDGNPIFANPALLDLAGHDDLPAWVATGGIQGLFGDQLDEVPENGDATMLTLATRTHGDATVEVRRAEIGWGEAPATLVSLARSPDPADDQERRALALDLSASYDRSAELAASLDLAADGIVTLDTSGRILSVSRSAERLFGYAANEIVGEVVTTLIAPEDHRETLSCLDAVAKAEPGTARECEARGRPRIGAGRPLSIRAGMVPGLAGPTYLLAFRDLSRFKALEGELREARGVAERAGANRADFLARISHEIRTPITAITGFAELMLDERFGPLGSERYRGYVRDIYDSGGHVVSLVNDLLDLAKASSGRSDLDPVRIDLNEIVQHCMALSAPLAGREKTILRTSLDPALPPIWADERSVRQIVLNVLSNAIRFTGAGGQVIVSTASAGPGDVRLSVRDTGPGMSDDDIEAALTPFRQVSATRRSDGTGLGLPLSKALVEANGGVFRITSAPNHGTLIAVHLPAAAPQAGAVAAE